MLISYRFKNFCSFAEEAEFDMMAPGNKVKHRFPDNYVETEEGYDILKTAVVIGEMPEERQILLTAFLF